MKIAVFNRIFSKKAGGAERYSVALVEELAAKHEFHIFAQEINHTWPGVTYHRISSPLKRFRWLNQLWYATATWWQTRPASGLGFDIVHSHENTWHGNVQTVHVLPIKHNLFSNKMGWRKVGAWLKVITSPRLLAYLALEKGRFADQTSNNPREIIVTAPSLLHIFNSTYPNHKNSISIITPGVAKADLNFDKKALREEFNIPENCFAIAFVGNRYDIKGLPTLLLAMQQLPEYVHLTVVGNNEEIDRFQKLSKRFNLNNSSLDRVHFLGAISDVTKVYHAADCLAHPTLEDTFAMVVLEAMSYGLPVIVSQEKYCGIAGLLTEQTNALILNDPKDAAVLAQKLQSLLDHSELRRQLSTEALKFANNYSWAGIAQEQEQIYLKLAV